MGWRKRHAYYTSCKMLKPNNAVLLRFHFFFENTIMYITTSATLHYMHWLTGYWLHTHAHVHIHTHKHFTIIQFNTISYFITIFTLLKELNYRTICKLKTKFLSFKNKKSTIILYCTVLQYNHHYHHHHRISSFNTFFSSYTAFELPIDN